MGLKSFQKNKSYRSNSYRPGTPQSKYFDFEKSILYYKGINYFCLYKYLYKNTKIGIEYV